MERRHRRRPRTEIEAASRALLARAQAAGAVRRDLVYEDVIVLFWSLRGVIEATATVSPEAWLRHLDLLWSLAGPGGRPSGTRRSPTRSRLRAGQGRRQP